MATVYGAVPATSLSEVKSSGMLRAYVIWACTLTSISRLPPSCMAMSFSKHGHRFISCSTAVHAFTSALSAPVYLVFVGMGTSMGHLWHAVARAVWLASRL